ncbi:MAG: type II toxin-antitoxin system VapC family toxin [Acidimicrobiales bacterium]
MDATALEEGARGGTRVRAELAVAEQLGATIHVSSVTLAEVLRGHRRDARVHQLLGGVEQDPVTPRLGRTAGELLGRTARNDTVDAIVAVSAAGIGGRVRLLTADPDDLRVLTADMAGVTVVTI